MILRSRCPGCRNIQKVSTKKSIFESRTTCRRCGRSYNIYNNVMDNNLVEVISY